MYLSARREPRCSRSPCPRRCSPRKGRSRGHLPRHARGHTSCPNRQTTAGGPPGSRRPARRPRAEAGRSRASHPPSLAQATRPRVSPSMPQFPAPAIAATTSNPCGRPSSRAPSRHGPPASSTSIRSRSRRNSARRVNAPPCREALCSTELVANSEATRIASPACGQPPSHPARAARASPTCRGSAGRFRCDGGCPPSRLSWSRPLSLGPDLCFTACRARATVGNGIGPDAH